MKHVLLSLVLAVFSLPGMAQSSAAETSVDVHPDVTSQQSKVCTLPGNGELEPIAWKERSDWINVKKDVSPAARGDGVEDDTSAIQAALDLIEDAVDGVKVIYLPPGNYRITRTLTVKNKISAMLVGHGSMTRILWDGKPGGRMFWSNGLPRTSYIGIVWDGMGIAGVGIDHDSKSRYETRIMHEHMEFRNFTVAGIRVGHDQKSASAEMMFLDLKFVNNRNGVLLQSWNDYNNVFDGNHFIDNDFGIRAEKGNVTVRNSRFQGSREADLYLSTHSHSVRRVVSSGSRTFIRTVPGSKANAPLRVEDANVNGWLNPDGAVITSLRGPVMLFNVDFSNPPTKSPPVRLNNPIFINQVAILSNVNSPQTRRTINKGVNGIIHQLPSGQRTVPRITAGQSFIRNRFSQTVGLLDVKHDCAARGDNYHDDGKAIQKCLDRAAASSTPVTLYFPAGVYKTSRTLEVREGARYRMEGTGWHSRIIWSGKRAGTVLHVEDPDGLEVSRLTLGGPVGTTSLLQTGTRAAAVRYHNLFGYHEDERKQVNIKFSGLPENTVVVTDHIDGRIQVENSSESTILFGFVASVQMEVSGDTPQSGFLGVLSRASALSDYPLIVRDNQSIVMADWYNEQTKHLLLMEGSGKGAGRVIIDHTNAAFTDNIATSVNGYHGVLAQIGGIHGQAHKENVRKIQMSDQSDIDIYLLANMYWHKAPAVVGGRSRKHILGNSINLRYKGINGLVKNTGATGISTDILDAFSRLGDLDLALNYCL